MFIKSSIKTFGNSSRRYLNFDNFKYHQISKLDDKIYGISLNNEEKKNALNHVILKELQDGFEALNSSNDCNVIMLYSKGSVFCSGLDLSHLSSILQSVNEKGTYPETSLFIYNTIKSLQRFFTFIEKIQKPIINILHGAIIGAGLALATVTDIRYCTPKSCFQIKEIQMGFPSDLGVLQRLPYLTKSNSFVREIALTGRTFNGLEARDIGLCQIVPGLLSTDDVIDEIEARDITFEHCLQLARKIAQFNPYGVRGTKSNLNHVRANNNSIEKDLEYAAALNTSIIMDPTLKNYALSGMSKRSTFSSESVNITKPK